MTEELKHRLIDAQIIITTKKSFTPNESKLIFDLYNDITGENMAITTCGACVNNVLTRLKKEIRAIERV
jgi:hypothetical protein